MHQIWADKYTQETVIKRTIPCLLTMQIYSDSELIFLNRVNDIAFCWRNFVAKLIFLNLLCGVDPHFWLFGRKYLKNYRKAIYLHFSNYRQNYWYRYEISKFIGDFIIGKIIDIEKKLLIAHPYLWWKILTLDELRHLDFSIILLKYGIGWLWEAPLLRDQVRDETKRTRDLEIKKSGGRGRGEKQI